MPDTPVATKGSQAAADVAALLRARNPLLWIVSREEARVERFLMEAAQAAQYEPRFWDCANGVTDFSGRVLDANVKFPAQALALIRESKQRQLWVMRDLPAWLREPALMRAVRSLARSLPLSERSEARAMVILTPHSEVPPELAGHAIVIDWPLPDRPEIAAMLDAAVASLPDGLRENAAVNGVRDAAIDAAVGLTAEEAHSCFAKSLVSSHRIDPATVASEKKRVIAREKVLEWFDPLPGGLDAVGGLDVLKARLKAWRSAFTPRARAYGLPAPKGVVVAGIPGCGKTLTAKAIATAWAMPLLRLDMGALKSKWVGESEGNIRKALKVAEAVAPCVLMLDEIEKALAGATQAAADGGVSSDALGAVLTWMQERAGSVFVVATANNVETLPAELLRKGRFDEVFFVDLPDREDRCEVLLAALRTHGRVDALSLDDLYAVADATEGFTGAELAALVPASMYAAFEEEERQITAADMIAAARATVPMCKTAGPRIEAIRKWGRTNAVAASTPAETRIGRTTRALDI